MNKQKMDIIKRQKEIKGQINKISQNIDKMTINSEN